MGTGGKGLKMTKHSLYSGEGKGQEGGVSEGKSVFQRKSLLSNEMI